MASTVPVAARNSTSTATSPLYLPEFENGHLTSYLESLIPVLRVRSAHRPADNFAGCAQPPVPGPFGPQKAG